MNRINFGRHEFIVCSCIAFCVLRLTAPALGNVGPPIRGGQIVAEPLGLKDVAITHETLTIDLRPLAAGQAAKVEAVYQLENRGPERKLELIFATGSKSVTEFQVWLDHHVISSAPSNRSDLPLSWQPPRHTPGIHDKRPIGYLHGERSTATLSFSATLPPGEHALKVRYWAEASRHSMDHPLFYWQFAYILAPAREWGSFEGLDVTIHLPENWQAACEPRLTRDGDVLRGKYSDLPADAIALTVQAPVSWAYEVIFYVSRILFCVGGLGGALLCWRHGPSTAGLGQRVWPRALTFGMMFGVAILAMGVFAIRGPSLAIPEFQENNWGYGAALAMVGVFALSFLAIPVGAAFAGRHIDETPP